MNKKGQNIAEYAIVIGLVGAALLAMGVYFQRSIQVVVKEHADHIGGFDSGVFSPQRVQEIGIEDNVDIERGPAVPLEYTSNQTVSNVITTTTGGGRRLDISESTQIPLRVERSYKRIEYGTAP